LTGRIAILGPDWKTLKAIRLPSDYILHQWRGSIPPEAIAAAVRVARESFEEHAREFTPAAGSRRKAS
jgi:hypothetical protein